MSLKKLLCISVLLTPACAAPTDITSASEQAASQDEAIVGGVAEKIQESPWIVSLSSPTQGHDCGGAILDEYHVLTARHCFNAGENNKATLGSPKALQVVAGISNLKDTAKAQIVEIDDVVPVVDGFDGETGHGKDVLLLRLKKPLHWNSKVQPIKLATRADERAGLLRPGTPARLSGWGFTSEEGPGSDQLLTVDLTLTTHEALQAEETETTFTDDIIAAVGAPGKDECFGDSGGPLVVKKGHGYVVAGLVSFGFAPCGGGKPGGYARVAAFGDAIERALCEDKSVIARKHGIAGGVGHMDFIPIEVPAGLREVNFNLFGGSGDVDMRIKKGARPTENDFDCKSALIDTNDETCNFGNNPAPGTYWIGLLGFVDYADVKLEVNGYGRD